MDTLNKKSTISRMPQFNIKSQVFSLNLSGIKSKKKVTFVDEIPGSLTSRKTKGLKSKY